MCVCVKGTHGHMNIYIYICVCVCVFMVCMCICVCVCLIYHHLIALVARYPWPSLATPPSSGQHPESSHSCWMYVRAGRPAFSRPCVGVHKSTSLMHSSLLLQQCPACLVRLTWIVFDRGLVAVQLVSCGVLPPGLV